MSERGRMVETQRRHLGWMGVCAIGYQEHVWTKHAIIRKRKPSGEVRGSNTWRGTGAPFSSSSLKAHHAQEERPLRSSHDSSNYTAGMCGGGHLAQARVYGHRETENGTPWM